MYETCFYDPWVWFLTGCGDVWQLKFEVNTSFMKLSHHWSWLMADIGEWWFSFHRIHRWDLELERGQRGWVNPGDWCWRMDQLVIRPDKMLELSSKFWEFFTISGDGPSPYRNHLQAFSHFRIYEDTMLNECLNNVYHWQVVRLVGAFNKKIVLVGCFYLYCENYHEISLTTLWNIFPLKWLAHNEIFTIYSF